MTPRTPNLWNQHADAGQLYRSYLVELASLGRDAQIVAACRQIRRYAANRSPRDVANFTFRYEIKALCRQGEYGVALRQLRREIAAHFGHSVDAATHNWGLGDAHMLIENYAPILYFLNRLKLGQSLLELAFERHF